MVPVKIKPLSFFAKGDKAKEAEEAGADFVGETDLVQKIQDGWLDFDVAIATPDMMAQVGRLGRVLGPKGLMPNPKTGTVTMDVAKAVNDSKAGKVTYRTDRDGNVHVPVGKVSFDTDKLVGNFKTIEDTIVKARPASVRGTFIQNLVVTSTFTPAVRVDLASF
jgi:large subunit ribosomal protein L1